MLRKLMEIYEKQDLKVNVDKTKCLVAGGTFVRREIGQIDRGLTIG